MCMIIYNDTGTPVAADLFTDLTDFNPDGAGVVWLDTWKVVHDIDAKLLQGETRPFIAHLRYATKGKVAAKNTHPFSIGRGVYLMHNGTIDNVGNKTISDTHTFAKMLKGIPYAKQLEIVSLVADATDSRMVVINTKLKSVELYGAADWNTGAYDEWTTDDTGIVYSKDPYYATCTVKKTSSRYTDYTATQSDLDHPVFVYGTLKHGYGNHAVLGYSEFIAPGNTMRGYTLENAGIPYLHETADRSQVQGELYVVSDIDVMQDLDDLEGHPHHYERKLIDIEYYDDQGDSVVVSAWAYHATHPLPDGATVEDCYGGAVRDSQPRGVDDNFIRDMWGEDNLAEYA